MGFDASSLENKSVKSFAAPLEKWECGQLCLEAWLCQPCLISRHQASLEGKDGMDWGVCFLATISMTYSFAVLAAQRREIRGRFQVEGEPSGWNCGGGDTCTVLNWTPCVLIQHHRELENQGLSPQKVFSSTAQPGYTACEST
eukprot:TRINITY_DN763_c6_g2_i2.p1 TRINITY_DN763_c6_g2~~TRINITY_DN763_c6_g2_i2.p1  ORF type:complete len:160 (+),score=36.76 TRINITY_DN763_c6_g2_i2:52-480(+)